jgi:hypothetical protein
MEITSDVPFGGDGSEPVEVCESATGDVSNWQHDGCSGWSERTCGGHPYFGGKGQCGMGSTLSTTIPAEELQGLGQVVFKFDLFTIDSWDDEWAYIKMKDQNGNVIA